VEGEVEENEDDEDAQGNQQLQALLGPDLVLPLPGPGDIVPGRQLQLLFQHLLGLGNEAAHVAAAHIEEDDGAEQPPLAADLGRTG